jgi:hypothetical protein
MSRAIARLPGQWPLKKVPDSPRRARGGEQGPPVALWLVSRFAMREAAGVLVDESGTHTYLDGSAALAGPEGGGARLHTARGAPRKPRQEHHPHSA